MRADGGDIYSRILDKLDENGTLTDAEWRQLVLLALIDLGYKVKTMAGVANVADIASLADAANLAAIARRVNTLEDSSLFMLAKRHPKVTGVAMAFGVVLLIGVVGHLGLWEWLFELLGIPPLP